MKWTRNNLFSIFFRS